MTNTVTTMMEPAVNEGTIAGTLTSEQESSTKGAKSQKKWLTLLGPQKNKEKKENMKVKALRNPTT